MAEFITKCPHCNSDLQAQEEWIGMTVECPVCKMKFVIERTATHHQPYNFLHKNKFWCIGGASVLMIIIIVTIICLFAGSSETETTAESVQQETVASQKHRRDGVHFTFKWGYLLDDLDKTEFKSFTPTGDYDRIFEYTLVTKNDYQYKILVEKSSRKITTIFSEDLATVKAFIKEVPNILESRNKVKDHEKASGYYLDCANDDVFLGVCKNDENKKLLVIKKSIRNIDQYFNVALDSF